MPTTIILLIILYLLYRAWRPRGSPRWRSNARGRNPFETFYGNQTSKDIKVIDEMKPCPQCNTYNPSQTALLKKGLYFCNLECHEIYFKTHQEA